MNGIFQIVYLEEQYSTSTSNPHEAELRLQEFIAGLESPDLPPEITMNHLFDFFRGHQKTRRAERLAQQARDKALTKGASVEGGANICQQVFDTEMEKLCSSEYELRALARHLGHLAPSSLNNMAIKRYISARRADEHRHASKRIQDTTIKKELNILRAVLKAAAEDDVKKWFGALGMPSFKVPTIRDKTRRKYLTQAQTRELLKHCHLLHIRLFILIAVSTGARKEAIERLMWSDVNFESGTIDFGEGAWNKKRPLSSMTAELKSVLLDVYKVRSSDFVIEYAGRRAGDVKKSLKTVAKRAGLSWVSAHVFKHTFISWLVQNGVAYSQISDLTNTSENTIRKHYAHLFPDNQLAVEKATAGIFEGARGNLNESAAEMRGSDNDNVIGRAETEGTMG
jgi:integrase